MTGTAASAADQSHGAARTREDWLPHGEAARQSFYWVFAFSMLIRFIALALLGNGPFRVSDESDYVESARVLVSGLHFTPYWSPGLPLFLTPLVAVGAPNLILRAFMLVFWVMLAWALWRLCSAAAITSVAWLILVVLAVMPDSIQLSVEVQTEQVVAALLLLAVSAAVRAAQGAGLREYALLGVSSAAMALVRPSSLPLILLLPAAAFLIARGVRWPRRLAGPVLSVILAATLIFGWMIRAHQLCGAWIVNTSNAVNLYYGNNPSTPMYRTWYFGSHAKFNDPAVLNYPEFRATLLQARQLPGGVIGLQANDYFKQLAIAEIVHHPGRFLVRDASRVRCYFGFDVFTGANFHSFGGAAARLVPETLALEALTYLAIAAPAFFFIAAAPASFWRRPETWLVLGALVCYAGPYWLSMSHPTYHFPILALMAVLAGMAWLSRRGQTTGRVRGAIALLLLAAIQAEWVYNMASSVRG